MRYVALVDEFNRLTGLDETGEQLIRYIKNQQKATARLEVPWPTFKGAHKRTEAVSHQLDDDQLLALRDIYQELVVPLGIGVDLVEANRDLCDAIANQFAKRTGIRLPALTLISIAEDRRKAGEWFTVGRHGSSFADLDAVDRLRIAAGTDADSKKKNRKPK